MCKRILFKSSPVAAAANVESLFRASSEATAICTTLTGLHRSVQRWAKPVRGSPICAHFFINDRPYDSHEMQYAL